MAIPEEPASPAAPDEPAAPVPGAGTAPQASAASQEARETPAASAPAPPAAPPGPFNPAKIALPAFVAALLALLLGYLAIAVPASWFPSASPRTWGARDAVLTRGSGTLDGDTLAIDATPPGGTALISINTDFRSIDYRAIAWQLTGIPEDADVRMYWRSDYAPARMNSVALSAAGGRVLPVVVATEPGWIGRITGIALGIRTPTPQSIAFHGVTAKPMGAVEILRDRAGEWLQFEGWTGTSMTTITGGANVQNLPLPFLLALAAALAAGGCLLVLRRSPRMRTFPAIVAILFVAAWFLSDLRWEWNLARQLAATRGQYAGKDFREKRLAAEDGPVFEAIEKVRAKLPPPPARVFVVGEAPYFRDRAAYHLYPYNVHFDPYRDTLPPSRALHAGDYLVVYLRRGIQYDPSAQRLRFPDGSTVAAELLLAERGAALFAIK